MAVHTLTHRFLVAINAVFDLLIVFKWAFEGRGLKGEFKRQRIRVRLIGRSG